MDKRVSKKTSATVVVAAVLTFGLGFLGRWTGLEVDEEVKAALVTLGVGALAYFVPADKGKYVDEAAKYVHLSAPVIEEATGIDVLEDLPDDELENTQPGDDG